MISHPNLVSLVTSIVPVKTPGICLGYSSLWLQAHLLALETRNPTIIHHFYTREKEFAQKYITHPEHYQLDVNKQAALQTDLNWAKDFYKHPCPVADKDRARKMINVLAFAQNIALHQFSFQHTDLLRLPFTSDTEKEKLFQLTQPIPLICSPPKALSKEVPFQVRYLPALGFSNLDGLNLYLKSMLEILRQCSPEKYGFQGFLVHSSLHMASFYYYPKQNTFCYMDVNKKQKNIPQHIYCTTEELAREIYSSFWKNSKESITLAIQNVSTHANIELVNQFKHLSKENHLQPEILNFGSKDNESVLYFAAYYGDLMTIRTLLEREKDPTPYLNQKTFLYKDNLIGIASQNGHLKLVQYLLSIHSNPKEYIHTIDASKVSPFSRALRTQQKQIYDYLLNSPYFCIEEFKKESKQHPYSFHFAIELNLIEVISKLLSKFTWPTGHLDILNQWGHDLFSYALINKKTKIAKLLLNKNRSNTYLHYKDKKGETLLYKAVEHKNSQIVELLLKNHPSPSTYLMRPDSLGLYPLSLVSDTAIAEILLSALNPIDIFLNAHGHALLIIHTQFQRKDILELIILKHSNPGEFVKNFGKGAFCYACQNGLSEIVKIFIKYHPEPVESIELFGETPLSVANRNGHLDTVNTIKSLTTTATDCKTPSQNHLTTISTKKTNRPTPY